MTSTTKKSTYLRGLGNGLPFVIVVIPFAMLFGIVAVEAGLNLLEVMAFSVLMVAGAAQFAALQLMVENAPTIVILGTALAVNLRTAMYSAALVPHLGAAPFWQRAFIAYMNVDQSYAMSVAEYERNPDMTLEQRIAYYFGVATPVIPVWYVFTYLGAVLGGQIPPELAIDFAVPIAFLAITAPMLRTFAHLIAAFVSITLALVLVGLPFNLGLLIAAVAAMLAASEYERRFGKPAL